MSVCSSLRAGARNPATIRKRAVATQSARVATNRELSLCVLAVGTSGIARGNVR